MFSHATTARESEVNVVFSSHTTSQCGTGKQSRKKICMDLSFCHVDISNFILVCCKLNLSENQTVSLTHRYIESLTANCQMKQHDRPDFRPQLGWSAQ